jgi:hypothetical protein
MTDSGAQGSFMHQEFAVTNKVPMHLMQNPVCLTNIDGTPNEAGSLTHYAILDVAIDRRIIPTVFFVTNISVFDVILGISWLQCHNPHIDWKDGTFSLPKPTCKGQRKGNLDELRPMSETLRNSPSLMMVYQNPLSKSWLTVERNTNGRQSEL